MAESNSKPPAALGALQVDAVSGRVAGARFRPSPHCDQRPPGAVPELVVIHGISLPPGRFGSACIENFFLGRLQRDAHPYFAEIAGQRVSAHLLITRDGSVIQFVPLTQRAWHAGASAWRGRVNCNDFSIGIELEGTDTVPYQEVQYLRLGQLLAAIFEAYPRCGAGAVVGHADIAPGRKTDPGPAFEWPWLRYLLASRYPAREGRRQA